MEDDSVLRGALRVGIVTWNVGNAQMLHDLSAFCPPGAPEHDVFAFGAQECSYAVKIDSEESPVCLDGPPGGYITQDPGGSWHHWFACLATHLGGEWAPVDSADLLEMRLIVFARVALKENISEIEHATEATGLLGVVGNKGGTIVRFKVHATSLAFISTHLAAHEGPTYKEQRNNNVEEVMRNTLGGKPLVLAPCPSPCLPCVGVSVWRGGSERIVVVLYCRCLKGGEGSGTLPQG